MNILNFESKLWRKGKNNIAGIDEAGRGPLAGPVVAAAVVFPQKYFFEGIKDSKKLSEKKRVEIFDIIKSNTLSIGIGIIPHYIIDEINILSATFKAMHMAIEQLNPIPDHLLVDGPHFAEMNIPATKIIDGDAKCFTIAAASIIAKVTRDKLMMEYDELYPQYGFAKHKGYGTKEHLEAIKKFGLCEIHRKSFKIQKDF